MSLDSLKLIQLIAALITAGGLIGWLLYLRHLKQCRLATHARRVRVIELAGEIEKHPAFRALFGSFDPQGHHLWRLEQELSGSLYQFLYDLTTDQLSRLLQALQTGAAIPEFIRLRDNSVTTCSECGDYVALETNGVMVRVCQPCLCPPEGPIEFELNVPSGELVYADDLRPRFDIMGSFDINYRLGLIQQSLAMARIGCGHGFVGNSCPGIYRAADGTLVLATVPLDDDTDEPVSPPPGEEVGSICTDLWWYSFVDSAEYERRGGKKDDHVDRLQVRPGVYQFSHQLRRRDEEEKFDQVTIYATITWVREPDPVTDYQAQFLAANFTAGQVMAHKMGRWPTLYGGVEDVANHIFCVGGGAWHPNGFVQYDPDMPADTPDMAIPKFRKRYDWYPLSDSSTIVAAAGLSQDKRQIHLNPSFVALAQNMLRCMIRYGTIPPQHWGKKDPNRKLAKQCLRNINILYP